MGGADWTFRAVPARRAAIADLALSGKTIGLLGYDKDTPVAWCSIAPRAAFGAGPGPSSAAGLWSLTCFFIRADHRNRSGISAVLGAAEAFVSDRGATEIEAYPVAPDSPSYRFSGFLPSFEKAGYRKTGQIGLRRNIVRKGPLRPQV